MRTFLQAVIVLTTLSSHLHAACAPGNQICEPSEKEARAKIERLLDSAYLTPHAVVSLKKLDGRSLGTRDRNVYEMRIFRHNGLFRGQTTVPIPILHRDAQLFRRSR